MLFDNFLFLSNIAIHEQYWHYNHPEVRGKLTNGTSFQSLRSIPFTVTYRTQEDLVPAVIREDML